MHVRAPGAGELLVKDEEMEAASMYPSCLVHFLKNIIEKLGNADSYFNQASITLSAFIKSKISYAINFRYPFTQASIKS